MSDTKSEIVNAIQDIHYMDVENISNLILEYDTNEFIETNKNSYIKIIFDIEQSDYEQQFRYHIDDDGIFEFMDDWTQQELKDVKRKREHKFVKYTNVSIQQNVQKVYSSIDDIIDHIIRQFDCFLKDENNTIFRLYLSFKHKNNRPIYRDFKYTMIDEDNNYEEIEETDEHRQVRFDRYIKMCRTNISKWMKLL